MSKSRIISFIIFCVCVVAALVSKNVILLRSLPVAFLGVVSIWYGGIWARKCFSIMTLARPSLDYYPAFVGWVLLITNFVLIFLILLKVI